MPRQLLRNVDIRRILYGEMPLAAWVTLTRIYGIVEDSGELTSVDYEPSTPGQDEPKWRRNVRNVLQIDKDTHRLDWNAQSSQYRLNDFIVGQPYPMQVINNKPQGGISHSNDLKSVACITYPSDPNNLYSDGWNQAGYYLYGGTGRSGNQSFSGHPGHWNDKVRNHAATGLPIQLFLRDGPQAVKFFGNFTIDAAEPSHWAKQIDDFGRERDVIQFHLWPAGNQPTHHVVMNTNPEMPEESSSQGHRVGGEYTINYEEALLVGEYRAYLREQDVDSGRLRFPNPRGREFPPLVNDIWVPTRKHLIEAKAEPTRENVRMVIGQIADYCRMAPQGCLVGALFNGCPDDDLLDLLASQGIVGIWKERDGGFVDNKGGLFING